MRSQMLPPSAATFTAPWPYYSYDEIDAVTEILHSGKVNYWTGNICRAFEQDYAQYFGCRHAIAVANGTVALELALYALGIGAGDEVVVSPRTFIASASAIVQRGAMPVFCDVDPDSGNITAENVARVLSKRTRAIIAVHVAGWPCAMDALRQLVTSQELYLIEDCAQSHGARYREAYAGTLGDISAWSFCQDKIITTGGEGGMVSTNNPGLWERMWAFKDHGKSWDAVYNRTHAPGFRWLHEDFGTNWRMTEMQAAIGRRQLTKLDGWVKTRQRNAHILLDELAYLDAVRIPEVPPEIEHAYYKCYVYLRPEVLKSSWSRDRVMEEINARGVFCSTGSCSEIYREKAFAKYGLQPAQRFPIAQSLGETSLMFQVHPTISLAAMAQSAEIVAEVIREATRPNDVSMAMGHSGLRGSVNYAA